MTYPCEVVLAATFVALGSSGRTFLSSEMSSTTVAALLLLLVGLERASCL